MRATGVLVHGSEVDGASFGAELDQLVQLLLGLDVDLSKAVHEDASLRVLSQLEVLTRLWLAQGGLRTAVPNGRMGNVFGIWGLLQIRL